MTFGCKCILAYKMDRISPLIDRTFIHASFGVQILVNSHVNEESSKLLNRFLNLFDLSTNLDSARNIEKATLP